MNHNFLSILQEKEPTFSKGQKRIARYITDSYDKAAFMTASKLGKTVGVSESTVVRFAVECRRLSSLTMKDALGLIRRAITLYLTFARAKVASMKES